MENNIKTTILGLGLRALDIRIPVIIPFKGTGFIIQGFILPFRVFTATQVWTGQDP